MEYIKIRYNLRIRTRFLWNRLRTSSHGGDDERINESISKDGLSSSGIQETRIALNGTNEMFTTARILIDLIAKIFIYFLDV